MVAKNVGNSVTPSTTSTKGEGVTKKRARASFDAHGKAMAVIGLYAAGSISIRACCDKTGVSWPAFSDALEADVELATRYARAREKADEVEFEGLMKIVDEAPPVNAMGKHDSAWVAWQRSRIDTRKWMLARKQPSKYGDLTRHEHSGKIGLEHLVASDDG